MTDEIESTTGQIAPALAHYGIDGEEAQKQTRKTVEDLDVSTSFAQAYKIPEMA